MNKRIRMIVFLVINTLCISCRASDISDESKSDYSVSLTKNKKLMKKCLNNVFQVIGSDNWKEISIKELVDSLKKNYSIEKAEIADVVWEVINTISLEGKAKEKAKKSILFLM